MYTVNEISHIINTKKLDLRKRRARYAIMRIEETILTYENLGIHWPALAQSMRKDIERLKTVI